MDTQQSRASAWKTADRRLDVSGSLCPVPVLKAKTALGAMHPGGILEVLATDPLAEMDLAVMCEHLGHRLIAAENAEGRVRVQIQRAHSGREE